jgi:hypothetical protein
MKAVFALMRTSHLVGAPIFNAASIHRPILPHIPRLAVDPAHQHFDVGMVGLVAGGRSPTSSASAPANAGLRGTWRVQKGASLSGLT